MKVMEVRGKQVRLSFDAPQDVHIVRESIITKDSGG